MDYDWNFYFVWKNLDVLMRGLLITLELTGISIFLALPLAFILAIFRVSKYFLVRKAAAAYIEFFRCTPILVQIVWVFYCLPLLIGIKIGAFTCGVIALTANQIAFNAESFRSGIQAVAKEQIDAAIALGLSSFQRARYIIFPQALRIAIPVLVTMAVGIFQASSLVSTVAIADLMYEGKFLATRYYRSLEILTIVALIYFIIAFPFTQIVRILEIRLANKLEN